MQPYLELGYFSTWSNVIDKVEGDREMKDESGQLICPASFACQVCVLLILGFFRQFSLRPIECSTIVCRSIGSYYLLCLSRNGADS